MNGHKSGCRLGNNSNIFDQHVYECRKQTNSQSEPMFEILAFMTVKHERLLLAYESFLHSRKFDTMN